MRIPRKKELDLKLPQGSYRAGVSKLRRVVKRGRAGRLILPLLPIALVPFLSTVLVNFGVHIGAYGPDARMVVITSLSSFGLLVLIFWFGRTIGREQKEKDDLASVLELSSVWFRAMDGRIEHWPQGCEALYGWTAAEAVAKNSHILLKTDFPEPMGEIQAMLDRVGEWSGELCRMNRNGKRCWVAARWVVQDCGASQTPRIIEIANDITALKHSEVQLRNSQERLSTAVATFKLGIIDFDATSQKCVFSPELEEFLGLPPGGLGENIENWRAMVLPDHRERKAAVFEEDIHTGAARRRFDIQVRRADGNIRNLQGEARNIYGDDGVFRRGVGIYMDVTDQIRDRTEVARRGVRLMELQSELNHVSRLSVMGEMAAALAHELNQPLTAVGNSVGAIDLLLRDQDKPIDAEARGRILEVAHQAETQAVRAGEIVRRLREFIARGEADVRAADLHQLIHDSLALALPNTKASGIDVIDLSGKAYEVLVDEVQIQQVLVNLIRNAAEAMRQQTTPRVLTVSTRPIGTMVEVSVRDSGPGVSAEVASRLFSPFTSTKSSGMGVGLSICRRIVEAHGGSIWLDRTQGLPGADFRFTLPLNQMEPGHASE